MGSDLYMNPPHDNRSLSEERRNPCFENRHPESAKAVGEITS
jgi:hypothetical protein